MSKRLGLNEWWAVQETSDRSIHFGSCAFTRAESIRKFEEAWPNVSYKELSHRGEVRCIRVRMVPAEECEV